ncbi:1-deoxy-D-xylulose 5-phosphate reductoisomerase [Gluconobacter thailandicus F149-1 = NBRC 100600]|uniref:1-deoxy-D-xylulose-5-phosphate reductoisomerase n=1 Tax=Gluconobacter thailandicus TaxID=257438 RepID=UPI00054F6F96|nr:1-deoxy-D-xylulose-5-phosphate reductoisomerase [Gluconobacter thailandicus]GAN89050.1 1-deoxy-D-xylulose 5-phosphate reductoisomerase [Gluconobacter frateurii M-2]KXV51941.1 1-deoxy-D-xylulose 5-phosphate reductoisomerase [Gluconobacter thailandicus]GAN93350.1 1-deoxy-D-xylulose 5-phosphate reductoisomerase [Gluconobacter thailandicus F149-1 = NBRC 100600]GBR58062.1 1-deoxy-D-xylulose 5-phosphate reductoisomerase [Gluconobacter thailandicus F149-1 = NBRC 100600]GEL85830.1 1-deoxy-D-xylulos
MTDGSVAKPRRISVLGSTGSIGTSTVDLLKRVAADIEVRALVGGRNVALLAEQARELRAEIAVIHDESLHEELKSLLAGSGIRTAAGRQAVIEAGAMEADWTMAAITGAAGLEPTLAAARNGHAIALANKEALVCAGDVMLRAVGEAGATLLPVDSEHNAIAQALGGCDMSTVEKIVLTASGGPFRQSSLEDMRAATPEKALKHPTWTMGAKITIDSASMANKGLEVIEAARLFGLTEDRIDVLVHPQSVVHGLVQFRDGSLVAQMGSADMRIPIAHTLAWPQRMETPCQRLDLTAFGRLDFEAPDEVRFVPLRLARQVLRAGGAAPAVFSAANEIAVDAFLNRRIGFLGIGETIDSALQAMTENPELTTLDEVLEWDARGRALAEEHILRESGRLRNTASENALHA